MTNLRPDLGSCTAELGHSRRLHFRDRLLRLDLVRLAAAPVGPRCAWIGPQAGDRRIYHRTRRSPSSIASTSIGPTRKRLLRPDDRVQTN